MDDLDALERELGPSLRVALRRAAETIDAADRPKVHTLDSTGAEEAEPWIQRPREGRRRRLIIAAAAAAVVLIAAGMVVQTTRDDDVMSVGPVNPDPTSRTTPTVAPLTADGVPPAAGKPSSSPETGELVAVVERDLSGSWYLYADGRLISAPPCCGPGHSVYEQRLTPEGVERVRQEFLASGLFQSAIEVPPEDHDACTITEDPAAEPDHVTCVRDGGRLLKATDGAGSAEAQMRLITYLQDLASSLRPNEWVDPELRQYVAPKYAVCFVRENNGRAEPLTDLPSVVAALPAPAAELLGGRQPTRGDLFANSCFDVTIGEARILAGAFRATGPRERTSTLVFSVPITHPVPMTIGGALHPLLPSGGLAEGGAG